MKITTRTAAVAAMIALAGTGCAVGDPGSGGEAGAGSGGYPSKAIAILAPGSTGGGWDTRARGMDDALTRCKVIDKDVSVSNKPGAGGTIGLSKFVTKQGDAHQLMVMDTMTMLGGILRNDSPVDLTTLTPIAGLTESTTVIVVPKDSPYEDFKALTAAIKEDPKGVGVVGGSLGGPDHILLAGVAKTDGIDVKKLNYVPTGGGGEALNLLLSGAAKAEIGTFSELKAQIDAGQVRVLARSGEAPGVDAPTLQELGYEDAGSGSIGGVLAPPGVGAEEQKQIVAMVEKMRGTDCWKKTLKANGWTDAWTPGDAFGETIKKQREQVTEILTELDIKE